MCKDFIKGNTLLVSEKMEEPEEKNKDYHHLMEMWPQMKNKWLERWIKSSESIV